MSDRKGDAEGENPCDPSGWPNRLVASSGAHRSETNLERLPCHFAFWRASTCQLEINGIERLCPALGLRNHLELRSGLATATLRTVPLLLSSAAHKLLGNVRHAQIEGNRIGKAIQKDTPVYAVGGDVSPPYLIHKVEPKYSNETRKAQLSGTASLSWIIDAQGVPHSVQVIRPLGLGLDEKAVEAVSK